MVECTNKEQVKFICKNTYNAEHRSFISVLKTIARDFYNLLIGVDLAICHSIIKRHDGAITAYSDLKEGATFSVYLPAVEPGPVTETVSKKPLESKGKILVMDEEESIRNLSIIQLSRLDYTSKACIDGAAAIKLYKNKMESDYPFDVMILDLIHNSGMGGVDAIKELLKIDPDVKGIVSTGYDRLPEGISFKAYGFSGVLIKPYTMVELENILSKLIVGDLCSLAMQYLKKDVYEKFFDKKIFF